VTARLRRRVRAAALATLTENHPYPRYGVTGSEAAHLVDREQYNNRITLPETCRGTLIDPDFVDTYRKDNAGTIAELGLELEDAGIRPGVSADLTKWLIAHDAIPDRYPRTKVTKQPSGDAKNLAKIDHDLVRLFIRQKKLVHVDDYLGKIMTVARDGRIHCQVNHLKATTGRMSVSGDFPYQQMPEPARAVLRTDPGRRLTSVDMRQIEPVVIANIAGDTQALDSYEAGEKFYVAVGDFAGLHYKVAKVVVLGSLYGLGIGKMAADLGVSIPQARAIQAKVWEVLPRTYALAGRGKKLQSLAQKHKKIFTLSGRILPIPAGYWDCWERHDPDDIAEILRCPYCKKDEKHFGQRWGVLEHLGVNYPTQGGAYDLLAEALYAIGKAGLGDAVKFLMHDEIVCDSDAADDVQRIMETPPPRLIWMAQQAVPGRVPVLKTDRADCVGESWLMPPED
jgi:DNA polymerase-1